MMDSGVIDIKILKFKSCSCLRTNERAARSACSCCPYWRARPEYFPAIKKVAMSFSFDNIFPSSSGLKFLLFWAHSFCRGYQPTLATEMGSMQNDITSIKMVQLLRFKLFTFHGWLDWPSASNYFSRADATTVLSRQIAEIGIYQLLILLDSTSILAGRMDWSKRHYDIAREGAKILQTYKSFTRYHCDSCMDELSGR